MSTSLRGLAAVLTFALLTAVVDVFAGDTVQSVSPVSVAAISFSLVAALFVAAELRRHGCRAIAAPRPLRQDVIVLNVSTAATWLSMLLALKYLEPAVVNVIGLAIGPLWIMLLGLVLRQGRPVAARESLAALGIFVLLGVLAWGALTGQSAVGQIGIGRGSVGLVLAAVCGLGSAANIVYSKRLSEAGQRPRSIMAARFYLLVLVSWVLVGFSGQPPSAAAFLPAVVIAVVGVALPMYLIQVGVNHATPIAVALLSCLGPAFTIVLQFFDGRLRTSLLSLSCVVGITLLVGVGVWCRRRPESRGACGRIAVVDGYGTGRFLPAALREHGVECVHVQSPSPDVHLTFDQSGFSALIEHRGDLHATAVSLRELGVSQLVAGTESGVQLADQLAAVLRAPGNGMRRPNARRDKYEMVAAVRDAGLATAASVSAPRAAEILRWAAGRGGWPVVLKPLASAGADNVHFCSSPEEIRRAHCRIMSSTDRYGRLNETVLAQEFLIGREYFVNTVSRFGTHHIVEIWRYHKRRLEGGRLVYDFEHPVPAGDLDARAVGAYALRVLDALEIHNGAGHIEVMLTERGPVLVECAARMGGSHLPEVVSRCFGTSQVEVTALAMARPEEFLRLAGTPYRLLTQIRYVSLISPGEGTVPDQHALAPIRALSSYDDMVLTLPAGLSLPRTVDLATSPGYVYLISDDPAQIERDYQTLRRLERNGLYQAPAQQLRP